MTFEKVEFGKNHISIHILRLDSLKYDFYWSKYLKMEELA